MTEPELITLDARGAIDEFAPEHTAADYRRAGDAGERSRPTVESPGDAGTVAPASSGPRPPAQVSRTVPELRSGTPERRHKTGEPRHAATERLVADERAWESTLDVFRTETAGQPEVFAHAEVLAGPPQAYTHPVHLRSRTHPAALVALAGMAAVLAVVLMQRSTTLDPAAALSTVESTEAPALPPVASPPVAPASSPLVSRPPAPVQEAQTRSEVPASPPPPIVEPERPVAQRPLAAAATTPPTRLPRPLSQDPGRLAAGVAPPASSRPVIPSSAAPVSPPSAEPSLPPAASATTLPSPPAVAPPAAAATIPLPRPAPVAASPPTPAAASPAPPVSAAPSAAAPAIDTNTAAIQNTLTRYRRAFSSLDANAAREVWPTVNERTLSRAFDRLEAQDVSFDSCRIQVQNDRADARCSGTSRYVPRVGSRTPRVERREWHFSLVKSRDAWLIGAVDAR